MNVQVFLQRHLQALSVACGAEHIVAALVHEPTVAGYGAALRRCLECEIELPESQSALLVHAAAEARIAIERLDLVINGLSHD
ncbi:MAG: hypothetical protein ABI645_00495 [Pseudomonadota bacterium]